MSDVKTRWALIYTGLYILIGCFSFGALILNIKTVPIIKEITALRAQNKQLKEANQRLFFEVAQKTSLKNVERKAKAAGMRRVPVEKMHHVRVPQSNLGTAGP